MLFVSFLPSFFLFFFAIFTYFVAALTKTFVVAPALYSTMYEEDTTDYKIKFTLAIIFHYTTLLDS